MASRYTKCIGNDSLVLVEHRNDHKFEYVSDSCRGPQLGRHLVDKPCPDLANCSQYAPFSVPFLSRPRISRALTTCTSDVQCQYPVPPCHLKLTVPFEPQIPTNQTHRPYVYFELEPNTGLDGRSRTPELRFVPESGRPSSRE